MGRTVRRGGNDRETEFSQPQCLCENLIAVEMRKLEVKFDLCGYMHIRHIESLLVRISLRIHVTDVSRQMQDRVHRHGQSHLSYKMRCLQEYETRYC